MTDFELHLPVAAQDDLSQLVTLAETATEYGYTRIWTPETWGRDAVTVLATIAATVPEAAIGTSVANVYSRSPALLGQTAATLAEASDGAVRLGIGSSGPALIEGWHGQPYDRPLRRTRETVEIIRRVLSGDVVSYHGDVFNLDGFRLRCPPPSEPVPIDVAALGPKAVELAGFIADGWHALFASPEHLTERLEALERGSDRAGRDPADVRVTLSIPCCVHDTSEEARRLCAEHLAFYLGSMGPFYRRTVAEQGFEALVEQVVETWQNGDRQAAIETVETALLEPFAVAGSPAEARKQLETFTEHDAVDAVAISFPRGATPADQQQTLAQLAPERRS